MGSWINYGLGSINENLPGYVVMLDPSEVRIAVPRIGRAFLCRRRIKEPYSGPKDRPFSISSASGSHPRVAANLDRYDQRSQRRPCPLRAAHSDLAARIASYELAFKMQASAPKPWIFHRIGVDPGNVCLNQKQDQ